MTSPHPILRCASAIVLAVALFTASPALAARGGKKGPPPPSEPVVTVLEVYPPEDGLLPEPGGICGLELCWPHGGWTRLSARLATHDGRPVEGRYVRLSTQDPNQYVDMLMCNGVTDATGYAWCDARKSWGISTMARADFYGDAGYLPSSDRWERLDVGVQ